MGGVNEIVENIRARHVFTQQINYPNPSDGALISMAEQAHEDRKTLLDLIDAGLLKSG